MFINRKGRFKGRLSPIEMLVLGTLKEKALYGNEIMDKLRNQFKETSFIPQSGTIYPLLERLEKKSILKSININTGKKFRKKYELTEEGRKIIIEILNNREIQKEIEFSNKFFDYFFSNSFLNFIRNITEIGENITEIGENIAEIGENIAEGFEKSFRNLKLNRIKEEIKIIQSQINYHEEQLKNLMNKKKQKELKIQQLEEKKVIFN
ncbi:MAG: PadR family transcriptional regulator [Candidatus Lokiarchaeota archaeon]|nr:PadR family transcriptional regulator [Candidatus Lokiarchaeota archaeon]